MNTNINEDDLKLLAFLHENVAGCGPEYPILAPTIQQELGMTGAALQRVGSFLQGFGLVGMVGNKMTTFGPKQFNLHGIYLESLGENFMRELESSPGVARKITTKIVSEMGSALRAIATGVLTEFLNRRS